MKNKKQFLSMVIIILLFCQITLSTGSEVKAANPKTIYVDDVPGEGPNNPPEDFTSIQEAINFASPGDTVFVYSGEYHENLIIDGKDSLTIEGEEKETTFILDTGDRM